MKRKPFWVILIVLLLGLLLLFPIAIDGLVEIYPTPDTGYRTYTLGKSQYPTRWEEGDGSSIQINLFTNNLEFISDIENEREYLKFNITMQIINMLDEEIFIRKPSPIMENYNTNSRLVFADCPFEVGVEDKITLLPDPFLSKAQEDYFLLEHRGTYEDTQVVYVRIYSQQGYKNVLDRCQYYIEYTNIDPGYLIYPDEWLPGGLISIKRMITPDWDNLLEWEYDHTLEVDLGTFIGRVWSNHELLVDHLNQEPTKK